MEEKRSECGTFQSPVFYDIRDTCSRSQLMDKHDEFTGCCSELPKHFGDIFMGGESRAHFGDIYIQNINTSIERWVHTRHRTLSPGCSHTSGKSSCIMTQYSYAEIWSLPRLLGLTSGHLIVRSAQQSESHWFLKLDILCKYRVYLGFATGPRSLIDVHWPRIHRIVPDCAPIMPACQRGDLMAVRRLLLTRQASVADVSNTNFSPLFHAIDNGHNHIVEELLHGGADANQIIGKNQTSPLQWAVRECNEPMIRALIEHGADLQHVSILGRSVLSHLWIDELNVRSSYVKLMRLLQTADTSHFRHSYQCLIDVHGFSTLNRVACMGTHDELRLLLSDETDTSTVVDWDWDPMFNATHQGDLDNVKVLSSHFPDFAGRSDVRGWTLLHVAAGEGHVHIVRYLLENGADPQALSWPTFDNVHENLKGRECTAADVARAESIDREQEVLKVISNFVQRAG